MPTRLYIYTIIKLSLLGKWNLEEFLSAAFAGSHFLHLAVLTGKLTYLPSFFILESILAKLSSTVPRFSFMAFWTIARAVVLSFRELEIIC